MSLFLRDATHINWRTLAITRSHIKVEPGPGGGISFVDAIPAGAEVLDCAGQLVTRSFVNGHHHIYSALARGMPPPARQPRSFNEILELIWWNLDKRLDHDMIRASALVSAIEAVRCGCTFIIDHHASPNAAEGSLGIIAEALESVGVGHLLCYELSDRDGPRSREAGLAESKHHLEHHRGLVGLHASFTVSDELLEQAVEIARRHDTGVHIHVAEAESDEEHCRRTYGCSVAERLHRAGALDLTGTLLAHALHVDDAERELIRSSGAWVVHNTQSNQNNNVGSFDPGGLGDRIFIGTDGMHNDMAEAARAMYLEGQTVGGLAPMQAYTRLRRVHDYLDSLRVTEDAENNLVVLDYPSPTPITEQNWPAHVVYGLSSRHVRATISSGRVVYRDGRVLQADAEQITAMANEQAERLWKLL